MALADIAQKIMAEINQQIKELEKDFDAQKKALEAKFVDMEKTAQAELSTKTDRALTDVAHKISAMGRQENKKALLQAKRNVLDSAMKIFLESLRSADKSHKEAIYKKLLVDTADLKGHLHVAPADEAMVKTLAGSGLTVKADKNILGGFILHADGAEVDNTFHNLVYSVYRDELEMYFADQLKLVS